MRLFPYNFNNYFSGPSGAQGSPLDFKQATGLADQIFSWHSFNDTSDWI